MAASQNTLFCFRQGRAPNYEAFALLQWSLLRFFPGDFLGTLSSTFPGDSPKHMKKWFFVWGQQGMKHLTP